MERKRKNRARGIAAAPISSAGSAHARGGGEERFVIRTGMCLVEESTGRRWQVFTCSGEQEGSSWIETVAGGDPAPEGSRRITCYHHKTRHEAISLSDAAHREALNIQEGGVYVPFGQIVSMLLDPVGETPTPKSVISLAGRRAP